MAKKNLCSVHFLRILSGRQFVSLASVKHSIKITVHIIKNKIITFIAITPIGAWIITSECPAKEIGGRSTIHIFPAQNYGQWKKNQQFCVHCCFVCIFVSFYCLCVWFNIPKLTACVQNINGRNTTTKTNFIYIYFEKTRWVCYQFCFTKLLFVIRVGFVITKLWFTLLLFVWAITF